MRIRIWMDGDVEQMRALLLANTKAQTTAGAAHADVEECKVRVAGVECYAAKTPKLLASPHTFGGRTYPAQGAVAMLRYFADSIEAIEAERNGIDESERVGANT